MTNSMYETEFLARPGYALVSVAQIALPVYQIDADVLTLTQQKLDPVEEYVLRCVQAGVTAISDISEFLGIEERLLVSVLADMLRMGYVRETVESGRLQIAPQGADLLETGGVPKQEIEHITFYFDGLLRRPVWPGLVRFLNRTQLEAAGMRDIPPSPDRPPSPEEIDLEALESVMKQTRSPDEHSFSVSAISGFNKRVRRYMPANGVLYRSLHDADKWQLAFVVNGRLSLAHEEAFGASGFLDRLGIIEEVCDTTDPVIDEKLARWAARYGIDSGFVETLMNPFPPAIPEGTEGVAKTGDQSGGDATPPDESSLRETLLPQTVAGKLGRLFKVVAVEEHRPLLEDALRECRKRLLLLSPWIRRGADDTFFMLLMSALTRGVDVYIGYGYEGDVGHQQRERRLLGLQQKHRNLHLRNLGNSHAKVLLVDQKFAVYTSFNWLSFMGDPEMTFRYERGLMVSIPDVVDECFAEELSLFK